MFTDWDPALLATQLDAPAAKYENGAVTFGVADNGMIGCAIFKNGEFAGISTNGTFSIAKVESSKLKVQSYYDLQGRQVTKPTKGLYIVNGRKVVIK